jgi:hypothetical protein
MLRAKFPPRTTMSNFYVGSLVYQRLIGVTIAQPNRRNGGAEWRRWITPNEASNRLVEGAE